MDAIKEKIQTAAEQLILSGSGEVEKITTRAIAQRAGVAPGLINYHFQTKENLIELCVQRIIGGVVSRFQPAGSARTGKERVKAAAKEVLDFLLENPADTRISILGDWKRPAAADNTMGTAQGFLRLLGGGSPEARARIFAFTSAIQAAFLRREVSKECLGFDIRKKEERDAYLDLLSDGLLEGRGKTQ